MEIIQLNDSILKAETRISREVLYLTMAKLVAKRGTCIRRQVGCVITNKGGIVLSTGYNGVPSGQTHCIDKPCTEVVHKSGEGLDVCKAVHAEINALLHCPNIFDIHAIYVTHYPCTFCRRAIENTTCKFVVFDENYPVIENEDNSAPKS